MDEDWLSSQRRVSVQLPLRGMENVVATVTGYQGSDRFNLIKMIDRAGGKFVGYMNNSITHLVCWRFEGKKYELAKKFNVKVVNHQWIEECIRNGKRVIEDPYTNRCGEEVGTLTLDISQFADKESCQYYSKDCSRKQIIDVDTEDSAPICWTNSTLLNESEEPYFTILHRQKRKNTELGESSRRHHRLVKNNEGKSSSFSSMNQYSKYSRRQIIDELSDGATSSDGPPNSHLLEKPKKKYVSLGEREVSRGGRRLVKKNATLDKFIVILDPDQEHNHAPINHECSDGTTARSSVQKHDIDMGPREAREVREEIQEVTDVTDAINHEDQQVARWNSSFFSRGRQEECSLPDDECSNEVEQGGRPSKPQEISCVICLEGFNLERGLLLCGHRFCFLCIYDWARACLDKRQPPKCPLCKASFESIRKYTHTSDNSDPKVYTQTCPPEDLGIDVWVSVDQTDMFSSNFYQNNHAAVFPNPLTGSVCCRCFQNELEDLLERCNVCQRLCVHRYCLDPPLFPWTCDGCKDLQTLHRRRFIG